MQVDQDLRIFEDLVVGFCDEDTETWAAAARVIGYRAVSDAGALAFMQRRLAEKPGAGNRPSTEGYRTTALSDDDDGPLLENIHRFRHACCAMASYVSEAHADTDIVNETLDEWIRRPLIELCLDALRRNGGTLGELKQLPGLAEQFGRWLTGRIAEKQKNIEKFRSSDNPRALEANEKELQTLEALNDRSAIPGGFRRTGAALREGCEWVLACYLAGVRTEKALLGLPMPLLVGALLATATRNAAAGLPYVLSVPGMLRRLEDSVRPRHWNEAVSRLADGICPDWAEAREPYNEYTVNLAGLSGSATFRKLWDGHVALPEWLDRDLTELAALATDETNAREAQRLACRIMRDIARQYFGDDWHWRERTAGEQFSLNVFSLLMVYGPGALLLGSKDFDAEALERCRPRLQHRLPLLLDAIDLSLRARSTVLPSLVRCLKNLLRCELEQSASMPPPKSGPRRCRQALDELMELCRRQLLLVRPLLADWLLPATLRKDLATIVSRVLHKVYRIQLQYRGTLARDTAQTGEYTVELVYIMLYAFPDNLLLREMIEYASEDDLCRLFDCVRQLIEEFEGHEAAGVDGLPAENTAGRLQAAESWKRRYKDFTELLCKISLHDVRGAGQPRWIDGLYDTVMHLARESVGGDGGGGSEKPLQQILLYGQKSRQNGRELLDVAKGHREDRTGALDERSERLSRESLVARGVTNRFEDLVDDIRILETDCLPEAGHSRMDDELVHRWRRLINRLSDLHRLCGEELPGLERKLCALLIDRRIRQNLEPRLERIVEIVDQEKESDAIATLQAHVEARRPDAAKDDTPAGPGRDVSLIQDWMLGRYMIRELAESYGLRVLTYLTDLRFIAVWILLPFLICADLHVLKLDAWRGMPFALAFLANVALLAVFALEARWRLPRLGHIRISPWRFFLPQTTAAIFLAIFSSIPSDERWSLTIKANLSVQVLTWIMYLIIGFIFMREIILGKQLRGSQYRREKNRRAGQLMALSLWQAFTLVMFFSITVGRIMAASDRGNIDSTQFMGLGKLFSNLLPTEVYLGEGFLDPASTRADAAFWIYPRALISWTIQMFFFGAIFERVMGRSES